MTIVPEDRREDKYLKYLSDHIGGVQRAYIEILEPYLITESGLTVEDLTKLRLQIEDHDGSKYSTEEWEPYLDHFYPKDKETESQKTAYDKAWLHHQKVNPHHWQYWILVKDSPKNGESKYVPLDMDDFAIYEMLCDWSSFQFTRPGSTANKWYEDNKGQIILSDNTRSIVEKILRECPEL